MQLTDYVTLGRSGLKISPVGLGAMTFGADWGWGSPEEVAKEIFDAYVDAGGNFIDTADMYVDGKSEEMLAKFVKERSLRDNIVIATKFTFNGTKGNPNAGGNGRKNIYRAVEGSLKRLGTDYIDLYWLHAWDRVTPVEEVLSTMNDLVRQGKVRYFGLSDVPAWYMAKMQTLALAQGMEPMIALQLEYSLVERNIEREHIPAAQEFGVGICPWSPLAGGFLTGKYTRDGNGGTGRLEAMKASGNPAFDKFTERNWAILESLNAVAKEIGARPAQVALNWVLNRPGITSTLIGATKIAQFRDNLAAMQLEIPAELRAKLDASSQPERIHPYIFFGPELQTMITGGAKVNPWRPAALV